MSVGYFSSHGCVRVEIDEDRVLLVLRDSITGHTIQAGINHEDAVMLVVAIRELEPLLVERAAATDAQITHTTGLRSIGKEFDRLQAAAAG